jgi:two-component system chemotaxis sensor kinase CheA
VATDPYKYFRVEARELLEGLGRGVLELEKGAWDKDLIAKLLRLAHPLKGAARVVKLGDVAEQAHAFEEALAPYRRHSGPVPGAQADTLLRFLDTMGERIRTIDASPAAASPSAARRDGGDEPLDTVRIEVREMDDLLEGVTEATVQVNALRRDGAAMERMVRLSSLLVDQLSARRTGDSSAGAPIGGGVKVLSLAEDLRRSLQAVQRSVSVGVAHVTSELGQVRDAANRLRLIPASSLFVALERVSRDAALSLEKAVVFHASGGDTRLDAHVLLELRGALVQLVRNAVAHGIESREERALAGKPAAGSVELTVERRGGKVLFHCRDDGRGIDVVALRRAVASRGLRSASDAQALDLQGVFKVILEGGVTTTRTVTEVSGRGVGLDVVREAAARLKGDVSVQSEPGRGTDVELCVPVSLLSLAVLQFDVAGSSASLPLDSVCRTMRVADADIARSGNGDSVIYEGNVIPFVPLAKALHPSAPSAAPARFHFTVVVRSGSSLAAVGVDRLRGTANVVVRSLPPDVDVGPIVSGASLDAEGNPQLVLDPGGIVAASRVAASQRVHAEVVVPRRPVLVVDDSLTTRMLEQSILESAGYEVHVAGSAEEALAKAAEQPYGLFIVDVEMPGMNGFEFVARTRADPALRAIPAVLLTSRESDEDKRRGREAGARAYIVKGEFDQGALLQTIRGLVG